MFAQLPSSRVSTRREVNVRQPLRVTAQESSALQCNNESALQRCCFLTKRSVTDAYARIRTARAATKAKYERQARAEEMEKKAGGLGKLFSGVVSALDFQVDIAADRKALADAKRLKKGERLSSESEAALKRKVGGTASNFFGEYVDTNGKYRDQGYVSSTKSEGPPYVIFLVLVVLGIVAATVVVVAKTG